MRQTWRWFGPSDLAKIDDIVQAGAEGVVSALHHIPDGAIWTKDEIVRRQDQIARRADGSPSGLAWEVVESLPVSEDIKTQKGEWRTHIANYRLSLENIAAAGIGTVCYNFMPVLDWTRTDLNWRLPSGATCMRFDIVDFAVFDIHLLERPNAYADFDPAIVTEAASRHRAMEDSRKRQLVGNITAGLPGASEILTLAGVRDRIATYDAVPADRLRANFIAFLEEVVPVAERLGLRLCCHPDDPPF